MVLTDKLTVIHPHGNKRHYTPLKQLYPDKVKFVEFTFLEGKNISRIKIPSFRNPDRIYKNVVSICDFLFKSRGEDVVLSAEPFDIRIPLLMRIAERHNVTYHTSWPFWSGDRVPKNVFLDSQKRQWKKFLQRVNIVTVTKTAQKSINKFGFDATPIPHGVDTNVFSPTDEQSEESVVLYVGRYVEEKGIEDLLRVISRMNDDDLSFWFVGSGPLSNIVDEAAAAPNVENLGYITSNRELAQIYSDASVLVLPSRKEEKWEELFGIVLIEAMSCETPVIATDCVGPKEIVNDGETGHLVPGRDIDKIELAIRKVLDDDGTRQAMGRTARNFAQREYDLDVLAEEWKKVLRNSKFSTSQIA